MSRARPNNMEPSPADFALEHLPAPASRTDKGVGSGPWLGAVTPVPPKGIRYVIGGESWKDPADRTPVRLIVEEWGNLGPMEMNPEIKPNAAGFRVRVTEILAPAGARGVEEVNGVLHWSIRDTYGNLPSPNNPVRDGEDRASSKPSAQTPFSVAVG